MVSESVIRNKDTNSCDDENDANYTIFSPKNVHEAVVALRVRSGIKTWAFIAV